MTIKLSTFLILSTAIGLLAGCLNSDPQYEVTRAGSQTFLLNRSNGELRVVDGTTLYTVRAPEAAASSATSARRWPEQKPAGVPGTTVSVRTKYRDGQMLYVVTASPYEGTLGKARSDIDSYAAFMLTIVDSDGFSVAPTIDLKLGDSMRVVDSEGKPAELQWTGSQVMSADSYSAAIALSVGWRGFPNPPKQ